MKFAWKPERVPLKFLLGERRLFAFELPLKTYSIGLMEMLPVTNLDLSAMSVEKIDPGYSGYMIRRIPIADRQPTLRSYPGFVCYIPTQDPRYYIDLRQSFAEYQRKFSAKTRATIRRKIRRFGGISGGEICWKVYKGAEGAEEFYALAAPLSEKTYQHKRLGAGLPRSNDFLSRLRELGTEDGFRGYMLFHFKQPVAYLYCPARDGVLEYQHLGYDPVYRLWSVGTILLWHALEHIHNEGCFKMFDFAGGQTDQIRLFATQSTLSANVFLLRRSFTNMTLIQAHRIISLLSMKGGRVLERLGLKVRVRKLIRFGRLGSSVA